MRLFFRPLFGAGPDLFRSYAWSKKWAGRRLAERVVPVGSAGRPGGEPTRGGTSRLQGGSKERRDLQFLTVAVTLRPVAAASLAERLKLLVLVRREHRGYPVVRLGTNLFRLDSHLR